MECKDKQVYYPTINYITIEKFKDFNIKATGIQTKRAFGIKALYFILKRFYNEDMKVIDHDHDWVLMTKGRSKSKIPMNQSKEIQKEEDNSAHIIETEEDNKGYTLKATFDA
ncbi:hypothetical protein H5410_015632 [Solanum commersonii]|uniref:Uncharacterized protein n=1 Tax=Solanum commersonii TaxID=4109 RepID=A0A9J5ZUD9_SOLCO|nr:hypothetical protein H5410_015632 [Solanum commersonii]